MRRRHPTGFQRALAGLAVGLPLAFLAAAALATVLLPGCTKPMPPVPVGPDAADAAPPPPKPVSCAVACPHYETVCAGSLSVCMQTCPGAQAVDDGYARCLDDASSCANCDALARASGKSPAGPGR